MSLTSYRAAPPRDDIDWPQAPAWAFAYLAILPPCGGPGGRSALRSQGFEDFPLPETTKPPLGGPAAALFEIVNGFSCFSLASKPGGDLLFHCLGSSTIGAVRFHGRVRDGIGWVTDAMATKLWGQRVTGVSRNRALFGCMFLGVSS